MAYNGMERSDRSRYRMCVEVVENAAQPYLFSVYDSKSGRYTPSRGGIVAV